MSTIVGMDLARARAQEMSGRQSVESARLRDDLVTPDDATLSLLSSRADVEVSVATHLGLQSSGTARFWRGSSARMAARADTHAALVASQCNGALLEAVQPQLERLLSLPPERPHGHMSALMKTAEETANTAIQAYQEISVELQAAARAQRATTAQPADRSPDARKLEVERVLQQSRATLWDQAYQARTRELSAFQNRINDVYGRMRPLLDAQWKIECEFDRLLWTAVLGGFTGVVCIPLAPFSSAHPAVLVAIGVAGACVAGGAVVKAVANQVSKAALRAHNAPLNKAVADLGRAFVSTRTLSMLARDHRDEAERALRLIDGQLVIHRMAEAACRPLDGAVHVGEDAVRIGGVVVPRKRSAGPSFSTSARPDAALYACGGG